MSGSDIVLQHGGWVIERYDCGFLVRHEDDVKKKHVVYPSSLASALSRVHENLLLESRPKGYDGSVEAFSEILVKTHKEFAVLLSPILWNEAGNKRGGEEL